MSIDARLTPQHLNAWDHYSVSTESHFSRFESLSFKNLHRSFIRFLPKRGGKCLDVGAGSGRDAVAIASMGIHVVAVEPSDALLALARRQHENESLIWVQDSLPSLKEIVARNEKYDFILLSAVWMHLPPSQREMALSTLSSLLSRQGYLGITLRLGVPEPDRSIYEVTVSEFLERSLVSGLSPLYISRPADDSLDRKEIQWVKVVLEKSHERK